MRGGAAGRASRRCFISISSTLVVVLASGAYADVQSYRYLMPLFAALPVIYAIGVAAAWERHRLAGLALAAALLAVGAWQQVVWIRTLGPDTQTSAVLACLDSQRVRTAYADYWLSYKLTFLTDERVIVAPNDGLDRYPDYARVRAAIDPRRSSARLATSRNRAVRSVLLRRERRTQVCWGFLRSQRAPR
jgi:hypothetical protein